MIILKILFALGLSFANDTNALETLYNFKCQKPAAKDFGTLVRSAVQLMGTSLDFIEDNPAHEEKVLKASVKIALCLNSLGEKTHIAVETLYEYGEDHHLTIKSFTKGLSPSDKKIFEKLWNISEKTAKTGLD